MTLSEHQTYDLTSIGLALAAHTGFGLYVVLVKYLLRYLPPFGFLALAFSVAIPVTLFVARRSWTINKLWSTEIGLLSIFVVLRSVSKLLAVQFTLATYVQLIDLTVPLFTSVVATVLLREAMPSRTLTALGVTGLGAFLVIAVDPFAMHLPNGSADLVGVALAVASSLMMALGVVYTRHLTTRRLRPTEVFVPQVLALALTYAVLSTVTGESWQPFTSLVVSTWLVYALFIVFAVIGGGLTQVLAISRINVTLFSTLLSWRLVVAVGLGWMLLGERLTSIWQGIGIVIVIFTITLYLRHQSGRR